MYNASIALLMIVTWSRREAWDFADVVRQKRLCGIAIELKLFYVNLHRLCLGLDDNDDR